MGNLHLLLEFGVVQREQGLSRFHLIALVHEDLMDTARDLGTNCRFNAGLQRSRTHHFRNEFASFNLVLDNWYCGEIPVHSTCHNGHEHGNLEGSPTPPSY